MLRLLNFRRRDHFSDHRRHAWRPAGEHPRIEHGTECYPLRGVYLVEVGGEGLE